MVNKLVQLLSKLTAKTQEILPDVLLFDFTIVNACAVGTNDEWVMVDAGLSNSEAFILETTLKRFSRCPAAIILTHGHFDHVGSLERLAEYWDAPSTPIPWKCPIFQARRTIRRRMPQRMKGWLPKCHPGFPTRPLTWVSA
ncbi:MBL fold metallo-hydrolase [Thermoclostridium caenicola]|uniref:MBL fold metallo-hydrolase n=1 Tax=Thermoclostridium caenicola TaxID=659425 RepID=UPI003D810695